MRPEASSMGWLRVNQPNLNRGPGSDAGPVDEAAEHLLRALGDVLRDEDDVVAAVPPGRTIGLHVVGRDPVLHQGRLPAVGDDRRPEEPQAVLRVQVDHAVGVGEAGGVGEEEGLGPRAALLDPARALDDDVVRGALAGAVEPGDEEVAVRQLHDRRRVVVPVLEREDELGFEERLLGRGGGGPHEHGQDQDQGTEAHGSPRGWARSPLGFCVVENHTTPVTRYYRSF
jgi:hypothetical protein